MNVHESRKLGVRYNYPIIGQVIVKRDGEIVFIRSYRNESEKKKSTADLKRICPNEEVEYLEGKDMVKDAKSLSARNRKMTYTIKKKEAAPRHIRNASMLWWEWQNAGKCEQWAEEHFGLKAYQLTKEQIEYIYNNK